MSTSPKAPINTGRPLPLSSPAAPSTRDLHDYIGTMAVELAHLARGGGDEALAVILEAAANRAAVASSAN